jgi:hypothetical protein
MINGEKWLNGIIVTLIVIHIIEKYNSHNKPYLTPNDKPSQSYASLAPLKEQM